MSFGSGAASACSTCQTKAPHDVLPQRISRLQEFAGRPLVVSLSSESSVRTGSMGPARHGKASHRTLVAKGSRAAPPP